MPEVTGTRDLGGYLRILWRWKWLFLFFVLAAPAIAYATNMSQPPVYQSSALVGVNQTTVNTSLLPSGGGSFSTTNVTAIARIVTTTPIADVAADHMHPPANAGEIVGEVSASGDPQTNFVTITAQDRNAVRAAAIANAFAYGISHNLQTGAAGQVKSAIRGIRKQLSHLGADDPTRAGLVQQLNQLRAARATQGSEAVILQPAAPSGVPVGLDTRRVVEIGLVIGLLLGFGAVLLAESADRRLRTPADLEAMTELQLLAAIAPSAFSGSLDTSKEDEEAFQMLWTAITVFNTDKRLQSLVVTSAREKEGKTTVAVRLALVCAAAGMRVILIDADLRRGQVSPRLGIKPAEVGLGAVLGNGCSLDDVLVDFPIKRDSSEPVSGGPNGQVNGGSNGQINRGSNGRLLVVPAGSPPANPSALIGSIAMRRVLTEAKSRSDLVIIDTPAALAVSDSLPLMPSVSGVILLARMKRSTRGTVRRLHGVVEAAGGSPLGVVATGVTSSLGYDHYSPKYYTHAPHGQHSQPADPASHQRGPQSM